MLPSIESKGDSHAPQALEEKNVATRPEDNASTDTHAPENGNVVDLEAVVASDRNSDTSSTNIFSDPAIAAHYVSVYEKSHYECRHVFDPDLEWTKQEENIVIRKLDWHGKTPCKVFDERYTFKATKAYLNLIQSVLGPV